MCPVSVLPPSRWAGLVICRKHVDAGRHLGVICLTKKGTIQYSIFKYFIGIAIILTLLGQSSFAVKFCNCNSLNAALVEFLHKEASHKQWAGCWCPAAGLDRVKGASWWYLPHVTVSPSLLINRPPNRTLQCHISLLAFFHRKKAKDTTSDNN